MEKIYNKLVRDGIPSVLKSKGLKHKVISIDDKEVIPYVLNKFTEEFDEVGEAIKSKNRDKIVEELADLVTVIFKLGECYGISGDEIIEKEMSKTDELGEFDENYILKYVVEKDAT